MNQPLGEYAGNAHEVIECLEVMKGRGAGDLVTLCEELSAYCLVLGDAAADLEGGRRLYRTAISSGKALARFREIVELQGGDPGITEDYGRLPQARHQAELTAPGDGYVKTIDTQNVGLALCLLGAGRETVDSVIDPGVGMRVHKKIGDRVAAGEPLCTLFYNDEHRYQEARRRLLDSYAFSESPTERPQLIKQTIAGEN
jgi:thymidine phosphorylase